MVDKISELLKNAFLDDTNWHTKFVNDANEIQKDELQQFTKETLIEIINFFIESILIGEYESNSSIEDQFDEIEKNATLVYSNLVAQMIEDPTLLDSTQDFVSAFNIVLSGYTNFCKLISIHKTSPNYDVLFSSSPNNLARLNASTFDDEIMGEFVNFFRTLELNRYDHFFDERIEYFKNLIELEDAINESKFPFKHVSAFKIKISFLKHKWVIRQNTTSQTINQKTSIKSYLIDNKLFSVLEIPELNIVNTKINDWKTYLEYHYCYNGLTDFYQKKYENLKLADLSNLNFYDLHFLIKFHKDVNTDYNNLSDIVLEIESREPLYTSNKTLYFKNLNYALNNQFSLLIDGEDIDENDVIKLRNKINTLQKKSSIDNFFVEYKYLQYCVKKLKNLVENREVLDTEIPIKKSLKEIRLLFSECERKINWSENHHNLLYQLPYEESLVDYNSTTLEKIYFASSFLLPISIEQANYDFQKIKIDFNNEFNHFEVFSSLSKEFNLIKSLKENVENNDKKSIETITIFTAIISFIVGSVSGFKFIDSFYRAIIFLLIFSTSLFSFVLLIFISTKGFEKIYKHKSIVIKLYAGIALLVGVVFYFKSQNDETISFQDKKEVKIQIKKQIDSLSKEYDKKIILLKKELNNSKIQSKKK